MSCRQSPKALGDAKGYIVGVAIHGLIMPVLLRSVQLASWVCDAYSCIGSVCGSEILSFEQSPHFHFALGSTIV